MVDSGAGITIVGGELFKQVAAAARLWKQISNHLTFRLDGMMDLHVDAKQEHRKRVAVTCNFRHRMLFEQHSLALGECFSGKMYGALIRHWWWDGKYKDTIAFAKNCPECVTVTEGGRKPCPPLHLIPVSRPFQILGRT